MSGVVCVFALCSGVICVLTLGEIEREVSHHELIKRHNVIRAKVYLPVVDQL